MPFISYIAWRGAKNYGCWHLCADNKTTLCGKTPTALMSVWRGAKPPHVEDQCMVCREVEGREFHQRKAS